MSFEELSVEVVDSMSIPSMTRATSRIEWNISPDTVMKADTAYSLDPVLIAAMEDPENGPGLTPGAWSSEPLEIDMRGSGIIKGLYDALLGCREGDYVESYMTYNMAYGDINFSTIPKESPVAYFFTVNSVE